MTRRKLTRAQRRTLAGFHRGIQETLTSDGWGYAPNYGSRGRSYYGIIDKLIRRGYIGSKRQIMQTGPISWVSMHPVTPKGLAALGVEEVQP